MGPEIFVHTNYDFVGKRHLFMGLSLSILAASLISIFAVRGFNFGVEFTGGAQIEANFKEDASGKAAANIDSVRAALEEHGVHGAQVQTVGAESEHDFLIRVQSQAKGGEDVGDKIQKALTAKYGDKLDYWAFDKETGDQAAIKIEDESVTADAVKTALEAAPELKGVKIDEVRRDKSSGIYTIVLANESREALAALDAKFGHDSYESSIDAIGAAVSRDLRKKAFGAIAGACILIAIYVWLRFDIDYAPGVVVALVHDAVITLGVWSMAGFEFNLTIVAAILAIIGYSVNDTVIVFDRIREDLDRYQDKHIYWVINRAVNDTLSRTILTSGATELSVISIAIFGSESIKWFGVAMTIGILVGTYSSIYVAAPTTVFFHDFRERRRQKAAGALGGAGNVKRVAESGAKS